MKKVFTYSDCLKEAKECKSRSEFAKKNRSAYITALNNNWLNDFVWLKRPVAHNKQFWDYEKCYDEAKKFKSKTEFSRSLPVAYNAARRNGWLSDYEWFAVKAVKWTKEACCEEAKKYNSVGEFRKNCPSAYEVSKKNGFLTDFSWLTAKPVYDLKEHVVYMYKDEENNAVYVGLTRDIRQADARRKMSMKKGKLDAPTRYFASIGKDLPKPIIAKVGMTSEEAAVLEGELLDNYAENGWKIINTIYKNNDASVKAKCNDFLDAIVYMMYNPDEEKSDTKHGFYMKFHNFNEWGDENPLYYGVDVYNDDNELVCSEKIGGYCGFDLKLFIPDSNGVLKLMAEDLATKCGVIEREPLPF